MDLNRIRKEIEDMAAKHKHPEKPRVLMAEFEDLQGQAFLDKSYCRLLGRFPGPEEKDELLRRFYTGGVSRLELLEGLSSSQECRDYGADVSDIIEKCRILREKEKRKNTFFGRIRLIFSLTGYMFSHKAAWRRLERLRDLWEEERHGARPLEKEERHGAKPHI